MTWIGMLLLAACTESIEAGDPVDCAGLHLGTYQGDDEGLVSGDLDADGVLHITFGTSFGDVNASGLVTPEGDVSGTEDTVTIDGFYDYRDCSASGDWRDVAYGTRGSWEIALE